MLTNVAHLFNFTCLATVGGKLGLFFCLDRLGLFFCLDRGKFPTCLYLFYDATVLSLDRGKFPTCLYLF